eukprot:scaffold797_cov236-Pinguiococcus_pyrenoidosus.AAC.1
MIDRHSPRLALLFGERQLGEAQRLGILPGLLPLLRQDQSQLLAVPDQYPVLIVGKTKQKTSKPELTWQATPAAALWQTSPAPSSPLGKPRGRPRPPPVSSAAPLPSLLLGDDSLGTARSAPRSPGASRGVAPPPAPSSPLASLDPQRCAVCAPPRRAPPMVSRPSRKLCEALGASSRCAWTLSAEVSARTCLCDSREVEETPRALSAPAVACAHWPQRAHCARQRSCCLREASRHWKASRGAAWKT